MHKACTITITSNSQAYDFFREQIGFDFQTLEEFQQSTTMFITLKHIVKNHNDYISFSYYGQVVMDI